MSDVDAVVIGSGAGGLASALALAQAGQKVLIVEQHYLPGGWCHSFPLDGYLFSPGVHYIGDLGPRQMMRNIYEGLGVAGDMVFLQLNPDGYDHVRIGDKRFDIPAGAEAYQQRLAERFPRERRGIQRFFSVLRGMQDATQAMMRIKDAATGLKAAQKTGPFLRWGLRSAKALMDAHFDDPFLKAILTIQSGNHGVAPRRAPAAVHAMILNHYMDGGYYPMGGGRAIPRAFLKALRKHGGKIQVRAEVRRIIVEHEGGRRKARGVVLADGTEIRAGRVISNADPTITFDRLVGQEHLSRLLKLRLARTRYGASCLSLFLAVDTDPRALGLDSGNVWYSPDANIDGQFHHPRAAADLGRDGIGSMFVTCTTLKDPSKLKKGHHTLEAFTYADPAAFSAWSRSEYEQRPQSYTALKAVLKQRMLEKLESLYPGITARVVMAELGTPVTNQHFVASTSGHMYGTEKTLAQMGPLGFQPWTEIDDLYLCGGSVGMHGVAGATMSGLAASGVILREGLGTILRRGRNQQPLRTYPADDPASWPADLQPEAMSA